MTVDMERPREALLALVLEVNANELRAKDAAAKALSDKRLELEGMSNKELRLRAQEEGLDAEAIEEARYSDKPQDAYVKMLMDKAKRESDAAQGGGEDEGGGGEPRYDVKELRGKRKAELRKMCEGLDDITEQDQDDAEDAEDPKEAYVQLLMRSGSAAGKAGGERCAPLISHDVWSAAPALTGLWSWALRQPTLGWPVVTETRKGHRPLTRRSGGASWGSCGRSSCRSSAPSEAWMSPAASRR